MFKAIKSEYRNLRRSPISSTEKKDLAKFSLRARYMPRRPMKIRFSRVHLGNKLAFLEWPQEFLSGMFNFWERGRYGYTLSDTWNLSIWHTYIMIPAMIEFIEGCQGHPVGIDFEDYMDELHLILRGFEAAKQLEDNILYLDKDKEAKLQGELDLGMTLFSKHYISLWN